MNRIRYHGGGLPGGRIRRERWIHSRLQEAIARQEEQGKLGNFRPFEAQLDPKDSQLIRKLIYTDKSTGGTRWKEFDSTASVSDEETSTTETPLHPSTTNAKTTIRDRTCLSISSRKTRLSPSAPIQEDVTPDGNDQRTVSPNWLHGGEIYRNCAFVPSDGTTYSPAYLRSSNSDPVDIQHLHEILLEGDPSQKSGISKGSSTHHVLATLSSNEASVDQSNRHNSRSQQTSESNQGNQTYFSLPTTSTYTPP